MDPSTIFTNLKRIGKGLTDRQVVEPISLSVEYVLREVRSDWFLARRWRSHADWFLKQMVRWGQASASIDIEATSDRVCRTDLFRAAAREMGVACPETDRLPPGGHGEPLVPAFEPISHEFPALIRSGD